MISPMYDTDSGTDLLSFFAGGLDGSMSSTRAPLTPSFWKVTLPDTWKPCWGQRGWDGDQSLLL